MAITKNKTKRSRGRANDTYFEMVHAFPLRAIRSERDAEAAGDHLAKLLLAKSDDDRDAGERQYLDTLQDLILRYQETAPRRLPKVSPVDMVRHLMGEHGMNVESLGKVIGSQPAASMILATGPHRRSMSKAQIVRIARHFKVSPGLFLDDADG